jgi:hypothetical protein
MSNLAELFNVLADLPEEEEPEMPAKPALDPSLIASAERFLNYATLFVLVSVALYFGGRIAMAFSSGDAQRALTRQERAVQHCADIHDKMLQGECIAAAAQEGGR